MAEELNLDQQKALAAAAARKRVADSAQTKPAEKFMLGSEEPNAMERGFLKAGIGTGQVLDKVGVGKTLGLPSEQDYAKSAKQLEAQGKGKGALSDIGEIAGNPYTYAGLMVPEAKLGGKLGQLITSGVVSQAGDPVTSDEDFGKEKSKQLAKAAGSSVIGGKLLENFGKLASPHFDKAVKLLVDEGVKLTPGGLASKTAPFVKRGEAALKSVPLVGGSLKAGLQNSLNSFNTAVMNRVLKPIGEKLPKTVQAGRDALTHVGEALSDKYEKLLPKLTFKIDNQLITDLSNLDAKASVKLPEAQNKQFKKLWNGIVEPRLDKQTATMPGKVLKEVESELSYEARQYARSTDPAQRAYSQAVDSLRDVLRKTLVRTNPSHAGELGKIDKAYAMYAKVRDAATRRIKAGEDPGLFTPSDLLHVIKTTSPKTVYAKGDGLMQDLAEAGHQVIPDVLPDSGTTERALWAAMMGTGALASHPALAAGGMAATIPYTHAGMTALQRWAQTSAGRESIRKFMEEAAPVAGVASAAAIGNK